MRRWTWIAWLILCGCDAGAIQEKGRTRAYTATENSFSFNGLLSNGLMANGLQFNGLQFNGLQFNGLQFNGLQFNGFSFNDLSEADSLRIMSYMVSCALPADQTVTITVDDVLYSFDGSLGVAPSFGTADFPSQVLDQRGLTACLMARTNAIGARVEISLAGAAYGLTRSPDEIDAFPIHEGTYCGNLWDERPWLSVVRDRGFQLSPSDPGYDLRVAPFLAAGRSCMVLIESPVSRSFISECHFLIDETAEGIRRNGGPTDCTTFGIDVWDSKTEIN
jgi:hypothetical protein